MYAEKVFCAKHAALIPALEQLQRERRRLRDRLNAEQRGGKQPALKALNREIADRSLVLCGVYYFVGGPDPGCPACNYVAMHQRITRGIGEGDILVEASLAQR